MSACDDCIHTYPDCKCGELDKEYDEVLDLSQGGISIAWCVHQERVVESVDESVSK